MPVTTMPARTLTCAEPGAAGSDSRRGLPARAHLVADRLAGVGRRVGLAVDASCGSRRLPKFARKRLERNVWCVWPCVERDAVDDRLAARRPRGRRRPWPVAVSRSVTRVGAAFFFCASRFFLARRGRRGRGRASRVGRRPACSARCRRPETPSSVERAEQHDHAEPDHDERRRSAAAARRRRRRAAAARARTASGPASRAARSAGGTPRPAAAASSSEVLRVGAQERLDERRARAAGPTPRSRARAGTWRGSSSPPRPRSCRSGGASASREASHRSRA